MIDPSILFFFPGEVRLGWGRVARLYSDGGDMEGTLVLTNQRIMFRPSPPVDLRRTVQIPFAHIAVREGLLDIGFSPTDLIRVGLKGGAYETFFVTDGAFGMWRAKFAEARRMVPEERG